MQVAIIGVGNMGRAMAERLRAQGHGLHLWNRTRDKAAAVDGAQVHGRPADAALAADVTLSILADDAALAAVYEGPDGLCSVDLTGRTMVEMSTTSSATVQALAARVAAAGGRFLECPVGGTIGPARAGQLLGLAGGAPEALEAARPVLADLTRRLEHLGPVGTGAAMKLAINLPLMVYWGAVGEAMGLATRHGVDAARATALLADSSGAIAPAKARLPALQEFLASGASEPASFCLTHGLKDMRLMEAALAAAGLPAPVIGAARGRAEAAAAAGGAALDVSLYGAIGAAAPKD